MSSLSLFLVQIMIFCKEIGHISVQDCFNSYREATCHYPTRYLRARTQTQQSCSSLSCKCRLLRKQLSHILLDNYIPSYCGTSLAGCLFGFMCWDGSSLMLSFVWVFCSPWLRSTVSITIINSRSVNQSINQSTPVINQQPPAAT